MGDVRAALAAVSCLVLLAACQQRAAPEASIFTVVRDNNVGRLGQYLAEGGDPNLVNSQGDSLLYIASGPRGGIEVLERLIRAGAKIDAASGEGRTALHNAAGWCDIDIVTALLEAGASADLEDDEGRTPTDKVCLEPTDRREAVLALLTEAGG